MERKLAAILCADVHGYSRLMGEDEEATIRNLSAHRRIIDDLIEQHHGRFVNSAGDSVLAEFASAVNAVECAVEIQTVLKSENIEVSPGRRMEFRIGVNLGDVVMEGGEIYGDGVNVAARLESLAEPGSIYISASIHEQVSNKLALGYEDLGQRHVKNIAKPVRVFRVLPNGTAANLRQRGRIARSYWRSGAWSIAGLAIALTTFVLVQRVSLKPPHISASIPPPAQPTLPLPAMPSIAVLPFTNASGDSGQEYLSDGISNQLIEDLSRLPGLFVIARNSSFAYKGTTISEQQIGRELGVKYILEGNFRRAADRVRIGVELVDSGTGGEMWAQRFDRPLADIFAVQDEIVNKVVTTVGLLFELKQITLPPSAFRPTQNVEAYDHFLRGVAYYVRFNKDDNAKARACLEKAIKLDRDFGQAYASLAWTYWFSVWNQWSENPKGDLQRSSELAHTALTLDDSNTDALAVLSTADWAQKRYDQAVADAQRAVTVNPNFAAGYKALSDAMVNAARPAEALQAAEAAVRLDPASRDLYGYMLGNAYYQLGRYQDAVAVLQRTVAAWPTLLVAHLTLAASYIELGRNQEARVQAAAIMQISPHYSVDSWPGVKDEEISRRFRNDLRRAGLN
jgi:adenylate cyclase